MCLEHCFNGLPVKHGHDEEWQEGLCGENPGKLKAEIKRLQRFLQERVVDLKSFNKSGGGYHLRRVGMEAERLLRDPEWFPGEKAAEAKD